MAVMVEPDDWESALENNHPSLKYFEVSWGSRNDDDGGFWDGTGYFWPNNSAELSRLFEAIGRNTNLTKLSFDRAHRLPLMTNMTDEAIFSGLKRNTSISSLCMCSCNSSRFGRAILGEFVANNSNLRSVDFSYCEGEEGNIRLVSALPTCANLEEISLHSCGIDDDSVVEFVRVASSVGRLSQIVKLDLSDNNFGRTGCEALATLLQDPSSRLRRLDLIFRDGRIDDSCATVLGKSLKTNRNLEELRLFTRGDRGITDSGWGAFSEALCDTSCVNATYSSNHVLRNIGPFRSLSPWYLPSESLSDLINLLRLNANTDKKQVAVRKILRHPNIDMKQFLEWDLKVLPIAISWFDRAQTIIEDDDDIVPNFRAKKLLYTNLSELYQ